MSIVDYLNDRFNGSKPITEEDIDDWPFKFSLAFIKNGIN